MLNEDKVKLMTRMAMYESKEGAEDFKISSYYRKDYSSFHTIITIILVTIGYMIAVGVGAVAFMDVILENLNFAFIDFIGNSNSTFAKIFSISSLLISFTFKVMAEQLYFSANDLAKFFVSCASG